MFESILPQAARAALALLGKSICVKKAYLAGGSALALYFGHRKSIDFDFFTPETFNPKEKADEMSKIGTFKVELAKGMSLIGQFNGVKISYFRYKYPLISPVSNYLNVTIAGIKDIAAMKLVAISGRSTKKDYIDLYTLAHRGYSLDTCIELYEQKYQLLEPNAFTVIRSMTYFEEADKSVMPQMMIPLSWDEVKHFFETEAMRLGRKYLE